MESAIVGSPPVLDASASVYDVPDALVQLGHIELGDLDFMGWVDGEMRFPKRLGPIQGRPSNDAGMAATCAPTMNIHQGTRNDEALARNRAWIGATNLTPISGTRGRFKWGARWVVSSTLPSAAPPGRLLRSLPQNAGCLKTSWTNTPWPLQVDTAAHAQVVSPICSGYRALQADRPKSDQAVDQQDGFDPMRLRVSRNADNMTCLTGRSGSADVTISAS